MTVGTRVGIAAAFVALAVIAALVIGRSSQESEPNPVKGGASEELWTALEASGIWVAVEGPPSESGRVSFVEQRRGDSWIFPVFSSRDLAQEFLAAVSAELAAEGTLDPQAAVGFPVLQVDAEFIAGNEWQPGQLVLDPDDAGEHVFSGSDVAYFKTRAGRP